MTLTDRTPLTRSQAHAIYTQAADDPSAHALVALMLLAGLRPHEVETLRVADWPGDSLRLRVGTPRHPRSIVVSPTVAAAITAALEGEVTDPEDFLLPAARTTRLVSLVRAVARQAGIEAGVHDLRHAAIRAAFEAQLPPAWICAYFGTTDHDAAHRLAALPNGWGGAVAGALEEAFT